MGKKKHKDRHGDKHGHKHETGHDAKHGDGAVRSGSFSLPLAGIAAMVTRQLQSPAARAAMATGLRAAADALAKPASPPTPPVPPRPEGAATVPPIQPAAPHSTARSPHPDAIAGAIGEAAELVLARLFGKKS